MSFCVDLWNGFDIIKSSFDLVDIAFIDKEFTKLFNAKFRIYENKKFRK